MPSIEPTPPPRLRHHRAFASPISSIDVPPTEPTPPPSSTSTHVEFRQPPVNRASASNYSEGVLIRSACWCGWRSEGDAR
ncbi:hypothetical protein PIB30_061889 [Stylosanthes scabra]|uniref:Uncharacterized protein n=1 Tax=Stylosanthes scabra TaxID=79078 RepID=A0ABU6UMM2_9FABA|nr:hypothetical protein [Stylosanthes scabra]